jgi:tetratricopeptide (TPR) repeat protein
MVSVASEVVFAELDYSRAEMSSCCIVLMALLLPMQRWTAQVSGTILDHAGKPLPGAEIIYKNVGQIIDQQTISPKMIEGTGRVYKVKTDKKGSFVLIGVDYGVYEVQVKARDGKIVYTGKKRVGDNTDPNVSNTLKVDLSTVMPGAVEPGAETNLAGGKKSKEQIALVQQENANAANINRLIVQFHSAVEIPDWPTAASLVQQLIALDPNRWEFYQNLGTIQANLTHYEDAVQSFTKGIEVAEKLLPNAADPAQLKTNIADMMIAKGDAYTRMDKIHDATAWYEKAAGLSPKPATAYYHSCNALNNHGQIDQAITECQRAIEADAGQWEFYQLLAGAQNTQGRSESALETYEKGVDAARKELTEKPDSAARTKVGLGQMLNAEGNLLVHMKKYEEAIDAFREAAEVAAYSAMPYFNLCATYYNVKQREEALAACEKAIASDPTMSDAYYIKASVLFGNGRVENGKFVVPPGTTEALNKYLEYAPFGQHANEVRGMIDKVNAEVETTYTPAKK